MVRDVETVDRDERLTIKGRMVPFKARLSRCTTCGSEFETPQQLDRNLHAAQEAFARRYDSPDPASLVALRSRYNASQKAFGLLLGFGELTMNSYEQGAVPDSTNRLLLKLAGDPMVFRIMFEQNSERIGEIQRRRILASEGYREAGSWRGLEALHTTLTPVQREKIDHCAAQNSRSIVEEIHSYVGRVSFEEYSRLLVGAQWTEPKSTLSPYSRESKAAEDWEVAS
jgi:DNA-binding transcriptional regulator YiaG